MNLLVSQWVLAPLSKEEGANTRRYSVDLTRLPTSASAAFDAVGECAKYLDAQTLAVRPGGNRVLAAVELLFDGDADQAERHFEEVRGRILAGETDGLLGNSGAFRWFVQPNEPRSKELLERLIGASIQVFAAPTVEIRQERDELGSTYSLTDESIALVQRVHGPAWRPASLRVTDAVAQSFEDQHGSLTKHIVELLTGLDESFPEARNARIVERKP